MESSKTSDAYWKARLAGGDLTDVELKMLKENSAAILSDVKAKMEEYFQEIEARFGPERAATERAEWAKEMAIADRDLKALSGKAGQMVKEPDESM